jgi:hypothetical protein
MKCVKSLISEKMAEQKQIEVNEDSLMQMMAADIPVFKPTQTKTVKEETKPEVVNDQSEPEPEAAPVSVREDAVKSSKRKNPKQFDFEGAFLKEAKIKDRRQMYISGEYYDKISAYLRIISDGNVSMVGYIHNVLAHHILEFKDMINEMYKDKLNKSNPL